MAIDQLKKRREFAANLQQRVTQLLEILNDTQKLTQQGIDNGYSFQNEDFNFSGLEHIDAAVFTNVLFSLAEIKTLLDNGHRANLNRI